MPAFSIAKESPVRQGPKRALESYIGSIFSVSNFSDIKNPRQLSQEEIKLLKSKKLKLRAIQNKSNQGNAEFDRDC